MTRVAVLDDDVAILEIVGKLVERAGLQVAKFDSGRELTRALHREGFDLFVLDWNVPDMSGIHALEWIRNQLGPGIPILLLTNRSSEEDIVAGLRAGADDFVTKPFHPAVLTARIEALLRRASSGSAGPVERYGAFEFNLANRTVTNRGEEVIFTPKEFSLSVLLFRHLNCAVARPYIMETVWGMDPDISTRTLDIHVSRIRMKLGLSAEHGYRLSTIYGYGYRLEEVVV